MADCSKSTGLLSGLLDGSGFMPCLLSLTPHPGGRFGLGSKSFSALKEHPKQQNKHFTNKPLLSALSSTWNVAVSPSLAAKAENTVALVVLPVADSACLVRACRVKFSSLMNRSINSPSPFMVYPVPSSVMIWGSPNALPVK